jgi:hypothetical protein
MPDPRQTTAPGPSQLREHLLRVLDQPTPQQPINLLHRLPGLEGTHARCSDSTRRVFTPLLGRAHRPPRAHWGRVATAPRSHRQTPPSVTEQSCRRSLLLCSSSTEAATMIDADPPPPLLLPDKTSSHRLARVAPRVRTTPASPMRSRDARRREDERNRPAPRLRAPACGRKQAQDLTGAALAGIREASVRTVATGDVNASVPVSAQ